MIEVDFQRETAWWDSKADSEEIDLGDERINRLLRWRLLERHLEGIRTILDIGAGTGSFSIPLAQRGYHVTHVDFSENMIEVARGKAGGMSNLEFVVANAADLSRFADRSFDLVLNMDGAISFCGSQADRAIAECCRLTGARLVITVSNRGWMIPVWLADSVRLLGQIAPADIEMFETGFWHQDQYPTNYQLVPDYLGALKAYLPSELEQRLEANGMKILVLRGLGSLANLCEDVVPQILDDPALLEEFLDLCERFDRDIMPGGPGTCQRAGLLAVAEPLGRKPR
jgi:SAM-dependent methyltransferase